VDYDTCGESIVPLIKWHQPLRYPEDFDWSAPKCSISESIIPLDAEANRIEPGSATFDFGLLHFTAQAANVRLQLVPT
jgi:hypothetical protein